MKGNQQPASTSFLTTLSRTYVAIQKQRIMSTGRIGAHVRAERLTEEEAQILVEHLDKQLKGVEAGIKKDMQKALTGTPIYDEWFDLVKGIGPIIAGGLIGEITDISRFEHISNLWSWAGLGIHNDQADKRRKGEKLNWNPHTKVLCWKAGKSFVLSKGYFRNVYDNFKQYEIKMNEPWVSDRVAKTMQGYRLVDGAIITEANVKKILADNKDEILICRSDGHLDARARRKTVKLFIGLTFMKWQELEGLPVSDPYVGALLGHDIVRPDTVLKEEETINRRRILQAADKRE